MDGKQCIMEKTNAISDHKICKLFFLTYPKMSIAKEIEKPKEIEKE